MGNRHSYGDSSQEGPSTTNGHIQARAYSPSGAGGTHQPHPNNTYNNHANGNHNNYQNNNSNYGHTNASAQSNKRSIVSVLSNEQQRQQQGMNGKKNNFFAQLFTKSRLDPMALAQTCPPPVGGEMPIGEGATLLRDRPAMRLDSRLVCKYEVLAVVGKGSFSQVLRVQHRVTKQFYAVKLVSTDSDFGAVNNELSILSRVSHPFVIRLEEVFRGVSKLFIVMEMASGGEMYDRVVSKGRFSEQEARQAVRMLLNGLAYLHNMQITHRDLKPENLLYSDTRPDARLLITDFGLAHQAKNVDEKMVETCGTPEYIAPEILLRLPYTNKVDMWAVGVIAYILMSGIMPFDDDQRSRLYTHIITADYVYYPMHWSGSELAKRFVDDLLNTNPETRLSPVEALAHDWVLGEEALKARASKVAAVRAPPTTANSTTDKASEYTNNNNSMQRTKSTRSIRSVTRSDHGHRVDPREVDKLANDLQRLAKNQRNQQQAYQATKHYGVF